MVDFLPHRGWARLNYLSCERCTQSKQQQLEPASHGNTISRGHICLPEGRWVGSVAWGLQNYGIPFSAWRLLNSGSALLWIYIKVAHYPFASIRFRSVFDTWSTRRSALWKVVYSSVVLGLDFMRPSYAHNESRYPMAIAHVFLFCCPDCGDSILLPRQSPLGIYEGQHYRQSVDWPIAFLCRRHERLCEGLPDMIHQEAFARPSPPQPHFALWEIDCVCGQPNCGLPTTIYTNSLLSG
jgi:hypothetical protein